MGLTGGYNDPVSDESGISIIKYAFSKGITFFDTSDIYGAKHANEILVGKALKQLPREKIQIATKFGVVKLNLSTNYIEINGTPEYVRSCCEASLKRLGVEYIDLYYQHRIDTTIPIQDTCNFISEASPDTIRRAHAVHPITAVQIEWSLWSREVENQIISLCRELGIGIVPYSPLGRGFFGGKGILEQLPSSSFLNNHPRFQAQNLEKNKNIYERVESLTKKQQCSPIQLALAWVLQQGMPIPGTTKMKNLDQNLGAIKLKLSEEELREISEAVPTEDVSGTHLYNEAFEKVSWKFANTPPKDSKVSA